MSRKGEGNGNAKLSKAQIIEMRKRHADFIRQLAEQYDLSKNYVSKIIRRERWAHLETEDIGGTP